MHRCCLMRYHSKGYQQGLQGWPIDVILRTTCISCVYESLNFVFMHVTTDLCDLKTPEYVSTLKKKIPTISAKESALIPLSRYQIYKICRTEMKYYKWQNNSKISSIIFTIHKNDIRNSNRNSTLIHIAMCTGLFEGATSSRAALCTIISKLGFSYPRLLFILNMSIKRSI